MQKYSGFSTADDFEEVGGGGGKRHPSFIHTGTVSLISSNPSCLIYNNTLETLKCGRHRRFSDLKSVNVSKIHNCFLKARIEFAQATVFSHKSQRKKHSLKKQKHRLIIHT